MWAQCDPFGAKAWATIAKAWATTSKPNMYTSFFKRERQYDPFGAKEIINRRDTATINKPNMHTSFFKRERQYDPFGAKAWATIAKAWWATIWPVWSERNNQSTDTTTTNKPNTHTSFCKRERQYDPFETKEIINLGVIPHSLSVSDNMARLQRKK